MPAFGKEILRTVGGLLVYLGMIGVLCGGVCFGAIALISPGLLVPTKVAAYGAPTRVRSPVTLDIGTADTPQTYRLGPPVVHRGPEPPSQAEIAKLRLKSSESELRRSQREMHQQSASPRHRTAPVAEAERNGAPEAVPFDARHSGNF